MMCQRSSRSAVCLLLAYSKYELIEYLRKCPFSKCLPVFNKKLQILEKKHALDIFQHLVQHLSCYSSISGAEGYLSSLEFGQSRAINQDFKNFQYMMERLKNSIIFTSRNLVWTSTQIYQGCSKLFSQLAMVRPSWDMVSKLSMVSRRMAF